LCPAYGLLSLGEIDESGIAVGLGLLGDLPRLVPRSLGLDLFRDRRIPRLGRRRQIHAHVGEHPPQVAAALIVLVLGIASVVVERRQAKGVDPEGLRGLVIVALFDGEGEARGRGRNSGGEALERADRGRGADARSTERAAQAGALRRFAPMVDELLDAMRVCRSLSGARQRRRPGRRTEDVTAAGEDAEFEALVGVLTYAAMHASGKEIADALVGGVGLHINTGGLRGM
jgi:hypothetical protein